MSPQFTTEAITTQQERSAVLAAGCCCPMPSCPPPVKECQSIYGSAEPKGFFDYDPDPDADHWPIYLRKFYKVSAAHSKTLNGSYELPSGTVEYVAETDDLDVERIFGEEFNQNYRAHLQMGDCVDFLEEYTLICEYVGTQIINKFFHVNLGSEPDGSNPRIVILKSQESRSEVVDLSGELNPAYTEWQDETVAYEADVIAWEQENEAYISAFQSWTVEMQNWIDNGEAGDAPEEPDALREPPERPTEPVEFFPPCTFVIKNTDKLYTYDYTPGGDGYSSAVDAEGSPEIITWQEPANDVGGIDFYSDEITTSDYIFETPTTKDEWKDQMISFLGDNLIFPNEEPDLDAPCPFGSECNSSVPAIDDTTVVVSMYKARYRVGIPGTENYAGYDDAKDAFDLVKAAWVALPESERGQEPVAPIQYPYFEAQWDEVFFPKEWSDWDVLKSAYDTATEAKEAWDDADPADRGPAPVVPEDPGEEPEPAPSLVASRSWTYGGTVEFSEWFEIPIPETEGETRLVNMRTKCHRSAQFGVLPTAHGETYPLP